MSILAKSSPNFANYLVVCEFGCVKFQLWDALMLGKLSVVKKEAENGLAEHNLWDNYIPDG